MDIESSFEGMLSSISSNYCINTASLRSKKTLKRSDTFCGFSQAVNQDKISSELFQAYFMGRKTVVKTYETKVKLPEFSYKNLAESIKEELSKSRSLPRAAEFVIPESSITGAIYKFDDKESIRIKLESGDQGLRFDANIDKKGNVTLKSTEEIDEVVAKSLLSDLIQEISGSDSTEVTLKPKYELLDKAELNEALKKMGPGHLKKPYSEWWSEDNPALGYCYNISEVIFHKFAPEGSKPVRIRFDDGSTHWWVKTPDDCILDQTGDQFDGKILEHKGKKYNRIPYEMGTPGGFLTKLPSKRTVLIMNNLGIQ